MPKKDQNALKANARKMSKIFMPWNFEKEQTWLEEQAREGWLLERKSFNYHFIKSEPQEMVYRVDYYSITDKKKKEEYMTIFEESGWEFVHGSSGWNYFRIPTDQFDVDIYSDPQSRIEQLKRISQDIFGIFIIYFITFTVIYNFERWFDLIYFIPMLTFLIFGLIYILKIQNKIKALNAMLDEEDQVPE